MQNTKLITLCSLSAAVAFGLGWTLNPGTKTNSPDSTADREESSKRGRVTGTRKSVRSGSGDENSASTFLSRYLVEGTIQAADMDALIKEINTTNDPLLRQKMFASLLENLTPENAKAAFLALRENGGRGPFGRGGDDQLRLFANAWGRIDGPGAVAALKEISEAEGEEDRGRGRGRGDRGGGLISSILAGWAAADGAAAASYVSGIEDEGERSRASFGVVRGMLVNGVDEAVGYLQSMPATEENERLRGISMAMVTDEILEQGLDQAKTWVDTVQDPDLRAGALTRVTMEMMQEDRAAAAEWLVQYGDEEASSFAANRLADQWSREDPQAAMEWAGQLSGESRASAYQETMENWARQDAVAAGEYLETLSNSPERDAAVEGYATRVSREDPAGAMAWAETITNAETRQETVIEVAQDWYRNDRAGAEAWIQGSGLNEEAIQSITSPRRDDRRGGPFGDRR